MDESDEENNGYQEKDGEDEEKTKELGRKNMKRKNNKRKGTPISRITRKTNNLQFYSYGFNFLKKKKKIPQKILH